MSHILTKILEQREQLCIATAPTHSGQIGPCGLIIVVIVATAGAGEVPVLHQIQPPRILEELLSQIRHIDESVSFDFLFQQMRQ